MSPHVLILSQMDGASTRAVTRHVAALMARSGAVVESGHQVYGTGDGDLLAQEAARASSLGRSLVVAVAAETNTNTIDTPLFRHQFVLPRKERAL